MIKLVCCFVVDRKCYGILVLVLGSGAFGNVYSVINQNGDLVAMKTVSKQSKMENTLREKDIHISISSRFIIQMMSWSETKTHFEFMLELCRTDLHTRLENTGGIQKNEVTFYIACASV